MYYQYPAQPFLPQFTPPVNPLLQFLPPAAQQRFKTQYHYHTSDGGVPTEGKAPSGSALDPPNQPQQSFFPLMQEPINVCATPPAYGPVPSYTPSVQPPAYNCVPAGPAAPPPYQYVQTTPAAPQPYSIAKPPPVQQEFHSTGELEPPVRGNRVMGQLPKFDNGVGHIFHEKNCLIHIFHNNVINKYPPIRGSDAIQGSGRIRFNKHDEPFTAQTIACKMTFEELIKQVGCKDRANHHPPYNQEGHGYPEHLIGVQELLDMGDGTYVLGTLITLTSCQAKAEVGEIWPDTVGSAGGLKPKLIVRFPV